MFYVNLGTIVFWKESDVILLKEEIKVKMRQNAKEIKR